MPPDPLDLAAQFRAAAERLTSGAAAPVPPATLTATQIQAVLDDLATRRAQVQALHAQLQTFDEQLGTLEAVLKPLQEWTKAWSSVEQTATRMWQPPRSP